MGCQHKVATRTGSCLGKAHPARVPMTRSVAPRQTNNLRQLASSSSSSASLRLACADATHGTREGVKDPLTPNSARPARRHHRPSTLHTTRTFRANGWPSPALTRQSWPPHARPNWRPYLRVGVLADIVRTPRGRPKGRCSGIKLGWGLGGEEELTDGTNDCCRGFQRTAH